MVERNTKWEENNVATARTGTRDGRRDGERYPEEETRDVPEAKDKRHKGLTESRPERSFVSRKG